MRIRDAVIRYQETETSNSKEEIIEINLKSVISAIKLEFSATGGTVSNVNNPLHRCITKIALVDGSDVLWSMSAEEAQALQWYKTGRRPTNRIDESASAANFCGVMILFGRYLWDQEFAFDPKMYDNPELKITYNLAAIRAVSATTAFATGTFKISVTAKVMEDFAGPGKFLMAKTLKTWTGATSGEDRHKLPNDYTYRLLMLQAYLSGNDINENVSQLKLTADTDTFVPFDRYVKEMGEEMAELFGRVVGWKRAFAKNNDSIWLPVVQEPQVSIIKEGNAGLAGYDVLLNYCWSGIANVGITDASQGAYATRQKLMVIYEGHGFHSTMPAPMGDMMRPETWFDPKPYSLVELVTTEDAAAANRISVEQVRTR